MGSALVMALQPPAPSPFQGHNCHTVELSAWTLLRCSTPRGNCLGVFEALLLRCSDCGPCATAVLTGVQRPGLPSAGVRRRRMQQPLAQQPPCNGAAVNTTAALSLRQAADRYGAVPEGWTLCDRAGEQRTAALSHSPSRLRAS